jgi:hypothetical protein
MGEESIKNWAAYSQNNAVTSLEAVTLAYIAQSDNEVKRSCCKLRAITIRSDNARKKSKAIAKSLKR